MSDIQRIKASDRLKLAMKSSYKRSQAKKALLKFKSEEEDKKAIRAELDSMVAEFMKGGGEIKVIPQGVIAYLDEDGIAL